jgi:hypothetical protein
MGLMGLVLALGRQSAMHHLPMVSSFKLYDGAPYHMGYTKKVLPPLAVASGRGPVQWHATTCTSTNSKTMRLCVDGACGTECYDMHMYLLWLVPYL